jgi:ketosteroid isomerase-like protein
MVRSGARTPEELEGLFEDAFIIRDISALGSLFDDGAVLAAGRGLREVRGRDEIERAAAAMWDLDRTYVAEPRRVLQAGDTALSLGRGINVVRRGRDGAWRFAIALIESERMEAMEERR